MFKRILHTKVMFALNLTFSVFMRQGIGHLAVPSYDKLSFEVAGSMRRSTRKRPSKYWVFF